MPSNPLTRVRVEQTPSPDPPPSPPVLRLPSPLRHPHLPDDPIITALVRVGNDAQRRRGIIPRGIVTTVPNEVNGEEVPSTPDLVSDHGSMSSSTTLVTPGPISRVLSWNSNLVHSEALSPTSLRTATWSSDQREVDDPSGLSIHSRDSFTATNNQPPRRTMPAQVSRQLRATMSTTTRLRTLIRRIARPIPRIPSPTLSPLIRRSSTSSHRSTGNASGSSLSTTTQLQRFYGLGGRLQARFSRRRR